MRGFWLTSPIADSAPSNSRGDGPFWAHLRDFFELMLRDFRVFTMPNESPRQTDLKQRCPHCARDEPM